MTRMLGINHVALEVGSVDEALAFLESVFGPLRLRGRRPTMA
jgi:catechol 2,3-dioxygenase-like lactoylglutathione lyase family enzyme